MRVFMTGGTGYIGASIVLELLKGGHEVSLLARNPAKIPAFIERPRLSFVQGDLDDHELIRDSIKDHQACIHNAIYWEDEPTELELKDTRASAALFEGAAKAGLDQIIYTSSVAVHRPFTAGTSEASRIQPADFYGATKACSEMFLSAISHQFPIRCNVIRPGPTIGPPAVDGVTPNSHSRFNAYIRAARRAEDIHVANGEGRQFISVADLAKLYLAVLNANVNRETYLALAHEYTTWEQIAHLVIAAVGSKSRVVLETTPSIENQPPFDVTKIETHFGLKLETADTMKSHIDYLTKTVQD